MRRTMYVTPNRIRAKREQIKIFQERVPESQGQNLTLAVLNVPHSRDSGRAPFHGRSVT
jgi:hypothetical protein